MDEGSETGQPKAAPTRDGSGRYVRSIQSAERDARAAGLKAERKTYQQIADELGYCDKGEAWRAVQRALVAVVKEPAERLIAIEAERLDELYAEALEVLERDHYAHSNGRVVMLDDEPLLDDGPKLQAIDRLVKIRESYRKLHGLDSAQKVDVSGGVRYEVVGVDPTDLV
jgi:hypothetical protein